MIRGVKAILVIMTAAPVVYILIGFAIFFGGPGIAENPGIIFPLFLGLAAVSVLNISMIVFMQSNRFMTTRARYDPLGRTYQACILGAIMAESLSVYGLILTILSGSILYIVGFSIGTWACLSWVRERFWQNVAKLPDK